MAPRFFLIPALGVSLALAASACSSTPDPTPTSCPADTVKEGLPLLGADVVLEQLPAAPEVTFERLDETLRSEATRTEEVRVLPMLTPPRIQDVQGLTSPRLSWVRVGLHTHVEDPVARLTAIHASSTAKSQARQALSARELSALAEQSPSLAIAATSKMLRSASALLGEWAPLANCAITNVPGSREPLYLQGARLTYLSAIMPVHDGMGLSFAVTSHDGRIIISPTSCRELMPDPEAFAQALRDSFQELLALAPAEPASAARQAASSVKARVAAPRPRRAPAGKSGRGAALPARR